MLTLREALTRATDQLSAHPELRESALADAALLLMHSLAMERPTLIAHPERRIDRDQQSKYQRLIERRLTCEPVQYITGVQEFYGLALHVTPAVLIPRPETELLVEAVLERLPRNRTLRIVDVGTGSGAIAIALAVHLPNANVTAVDLSPEALKIAEQNAASHRVIQRIRFLDSDLLDAVESEKPYDAIFSNPPYVASSEAEALHPQVRNFEPAGALFAGESGLDVYRRLIPQAQRLLSPGGLLALEFGHGQDAALRALLAQWDEVVLFKDLQGIPRVALARSPLL